MQFCMRSKWSCLWETFKNGVMWHPDNIKLMCGYLIVNIRSPNVKPVLMKNKRSPTHEEINLHFVNMLSRLDALIAGFYLYIYKLFFLLDARQSFLCSNLCSSPLLRLPDVFPHRAQKRQTQNAYKITFFAYISKGNDVPPFGRKLVN